MSEKMNASPLVYICIKDVKFTQKLKSLLFEIGYKVEGFSNLSDFRRFTLLDNTTKPDAIVMNLTFPESESAGLETLTELHSQYPDTPLVVCCKKDSLVERLEALRAGAVRYFSAPIDVPHLIDTLNSLTGLQPPEQYRVLVIDDEEITLAMHGAILTNAGLSVSLLSQPANALTTINQFKPEVIVLDVYMPEISGFELAAVLREKEDCCDIPILFLTSESDISSELDALRLGGDAYYTKPIEARRLVDAASNRARRYREIVQARDRLREFNYVREREHLALNRHALVSVTDIHGTIIDLNDKVCHVSGYARHELMGQNHRVLKSGQHPDSFYVDMWHTISKGETWHGEICNKRKDGRLYWVESTITPLLNDAGKPYQYIAIRTDITTIKATEDKLIDAKLQAEKANKAKSEFLANMSHELRTPLNAIVGFSQLLDTAPDLQPEYQQDAAEISKAGKHLLGLINDILELAKIESGYISISLEDINIKAIVSECVSMVMPMIMEKGLSFTSDDFGEQLVIGDRAKLRQVLLNLLSNAIKYNRHGGAVEIRLDDSCPDTLSVGIIDTGIGIAQNKLADLFKPFSRLDAEFSEIEGTGIGLTLSKEMTEKMHGSINVSSVQGEGSQFWLSLPKVNDGANDNPSLAVDEQETTIACSELCDKVKLVCVDDNETNLDLLEQLFARESRYELYCVSNPNNAVNVIREEQPDVIILDIHMPFMDGYDLLKLLRLDASLNETPVIALTASALTEERAKGLAAGFAEYLTKPLDYQLLINTINEIVNNKGS